MKPTISIGAQSFESIRENGYFLIDKTDFIKNWWENGDVVTLITRPRRFGKTLNLSMMECFFSERYAGRNDLFEGLKIWENEKFRELQGKWPVIFLSFANVKEPCFENARLKINQILTELYVKHDYLRSSGILTKQDQLFWELVSLNMPETIATAAIYNMCSFLSRYYGKKVILLLDEYDTPAQEAYVNGYWTEFTSFIRSMFNSAFKTNPWLERALMTGITHISKESIFSDMNNLEVITTTSEKYETAFGFTEEEVRESLEAFGLTDQFEKVQEWYDGFCFGSRRDIYNPWSITKYLDSGKFAAYWANTSSNSLVGKLIREGSADVKIAMETLLSGETITVELDEEIVFNQLDQNESAIWSLLLASGYLKTECVPEEEDDDNDDNDDYDDETYRLSLTNTEVKKMFRKMIRSWFGKSDARYNDFVKALMQNDVIYMNRYMNQMAESVFSFFDSGSRPSGKSDPERFYHGFVLGLIADSKIDYEITSNRESGFGRYDVMMIPRKSGYDAYVLEFKVYDPDKEKSLEDTVRAALRQIDEKKYDAALLERGFTCEKIRHYGFAFQGKKVLIG